MLVHSTSASGVVVSPILRNRLVEKTAVKQTRTSQKRRRENISSLVNQAAFPCHTDSSQWIVPSDHPAGKMGSSQGLDGRCCSRFDFVFEDYQTQEFKFVFRLFPNRKLLNKRRQQAASLRTGSFVGLSAMINLLYFSRPLQ